MRWKDRSTRVANAIDRLKRSTRYQVLVPGYSEAGFWIGLELVLTVSSEVRGYLRRVAGPFPSSLSPGPEGVS